ncbi:MAG: response regulator [Pseudoxanthomonas sp.]|nr:response regulator [Pseudoxanthomonas sp.]
MKRIPPRRTSRRRTAATHAGAGPPRAQAPRILVAEDHPVNRAIIGFQLQHLGYAATLVEDGRQALDALALGRYDLLLTDCRMPVLDGLALARAIRDGEGEAGRHLPIVALSGTASQASQHACRAAGMDGYLAKPVRVAELQHELARHLAADAHVRGRTPPGAGAEQRRMRRLVDAFGSTRRARQVLLPLLDACRNDLASLDEALQAGDRLRQRELLHRLSGALALVDAPRVATRPARTPRDPARQRDLLARRVDVLQRLLVRLPAPAPPRGPA